MTTLIVPNHTKSRNAPTTPTIPQESAVPNQFLEILSPAELRPGDLEIIVKPTAEKPGLARLGAAYIGEANPDAPKSVPLLSATSAKIGFVAKAELIAPPYNDAYLIVEEATR